MKTTNVKMTNETVNNIKAILNKVGAALMFPLSFLAFVSLFLGISFILPSNWLLTNILAGISSSVFGFFPYLAFLSLVNVYHGNKDDYTMIIASVFILVILGVKYSVDNYSNIEISFSLFSAMIAAALFINIDRFNIHLYLWVLIAAGLSLLLIPGYYILDILILNIGKAINLLPFGLNAFAYGFINRLLLPFGMHSIMIPTFAFSKVGGEMIIYDSAGEVYDVIAGDSPIWMTMYTNNIKDFALEGSFINNGSEYTYIINNSGTIGQYQEGFLPVTGFVFPILALSYCLYNGFDKGKLFLTGAILTMFSGVTETTEYFFIMINPFLYLLNAFIVGLSFMLCSVLDVHVWLSTGWAIDIILFGIAPSVKQFQTNWYWIPVIGVSLGLLYSFLFILIDNKTKYEIGIVKV